MDVAKGQCTEWVGQTLGCSAVIYTLYPCHLNRFGLPKGQMSMGDFSKHHLEDLGCPPLKFRVLPPIWPSLCLPMPPRCVVSYPPSEFEGFALGLGYLTLPLLDVPPIPALAWVLGPPKGLGLFFPLALGFGTPDFPRDSWK